MINNWLRNIKDVYKANRTELKSIQDEEKQFDRLVELNVLEQVHHLAETNIVQGAWKKREMPLIHSLPLVLTVKWIRFTNTTIYNGYRLSGTIFKFEI